MTDRRRLRSNGRVAHASLRGQVQAERFTEGTLWRVTTARAAIFARPEGGARERELILGEGFTVLEQRESMLFGFAERDGYVGWIDAAGLQAGTPAPTHRVTARHSYAKATPELKTRDEISWLPFGAQVTVAGAEDAWRRIEIGAGDARYHAWMPAPHVAPLDRLEPDPVAVAELLLGTPYLWGGNSSFGIDCSGLVQAALLACGIACPGDSDQQQADLGRALPEGSAPQRGDLLFWPGHVALVADAETLIHANAFHMAVAFEPLAEAVARIAAQGDGPVTAHKRF